MAHALNGTAWHRVALVNRQVAVEERAAISEDLAARHSERGSMHSVVGSALRFTATQTVGLRCIEELRLVGITASE